MAKVIRRSNEYGTETLEDMIKRFNHQVMNEGILKEVRNRQFYKSKGQKRREKKLKAERNAWVRKMKELRKEQHRH